MLFVELDFLIRGAYTWVGWWWILMAHAACGPYLLLYVYVDMHSWHVD
jgi:hypothetical protein